jgi:hypothetical protein
MNFTKLIHVTCVVDALHRVCEIICLLYPEVYKLVGNRKKSFVKLPARTELFNNKAPDTPFPPTPNTLRNLVGCHFDICCSVVNELERDDALSVAILQKIFNDSNEL